MILIYRIPIKNAFAGYTMDTILFFGSWIALLEGILSVTYHKDFHGGVSAALILGIH